MCIKLFFIVEIIQDVFIIIIEGQFEVVAIWPFDGDGGAGRPDTEVFPLGGPGEGFDQADGVFAGAVLSIGEFAGFEVPVLNFRYSSQGVFFMG